MTRKPFLTLLVAGGFVLFTAGMMMHIIERNSFEHFTIYDGPWIVAITQLTVGYGELSPHTDFGRIIAIGPGLIGVCTLSLVVTFSMRELALDGQEKQLVEKLYHNQYVRVNLCETAAIYLQRWWRLRLSRRFRDPERFRKLFQCKLIHEKFLREFAVDLAGASEELEDQIRKVQASISRQFAETNRKLNQLPMLEGVAGKFSTDKFNVVAKLLICKQAYLRCRLIGGGKRRKPRRLSTLSRRHNKRSSIVEKRASDIAIRKLKARLSLIPHGNSQQFGSKEVSPDESLQSSYSKVGRRKSLL